MKWFKKLFCRHNWEYANGWSYPRSEASPRHDWRTVQLDMYFSELIPLVRGTSLVDKNNQINLDGCYSDMVCTKCNKTRLDLTKKLTHTINKYFKFDTDEKKAERIKAVKNASDNFFLKNIKVG